MKSKKIIITSIVILSTLALSLLILMIFLLNGRIPLSGLSFRVSINKPYKISEHLIVDETYDVDFTTINITSMAGEISIKQSEDHTSHLIIYGDKKYVSVNYNESVLNIVNNEKMNSFFVTQSTIAYIELYLPKDYENIIDIECDYGNVTIDTFKNAFMKVKVNAGNICLKKTKEADLKNNCGNIEVDSIYSLKAENGLGNISIGSVLETLDISNDCGNIEIDSIHLIHNGKIQANLGNIDIGNTNEIYIFMDVNLGNSSFHNNYPKSDITLTITNDCGNINVDN